VPSEVHKVHPRGSKLVCIKSAQSGGPQMFLIDLCGLDLR